MAENDLFVTAVAPWKGSNRMLAPVVGKALRGCKWVGVPFAGGMSELAEIDAPTMFVNDKHNHVINLARVIAVPHMRAALTKAVRNCVFHPAELRVAQIKAAGVDAVGWEHFNTDTERVDAAAAYFVAVWMARSANAGTDKELSGNLSARWTHTGGDSNKRYRSAVRSIVGWSRIMRRCSFSVLDFRVFLSKCQDDDGYAIYSDAPFPDGGQDYKHKFAEHDHRDLRASLVRFEQARVLIRYYDHPLIAALYPRGKWRWYDLDGGRTQANTKPPEVLIANWDADIPGIRAAA